jgi:hypothetical protein
MICSLDNPCGAAAFPDLAFNRDMQRYGLPQRRYRCLAGHSMTVGLPDGLAATVQSPPDKPRRRRKRVKKSRRSAAAAPVIDVDPASLPPGVGVLVS